MSKRPPLFPRWFLVMLSLMTLATLGGPLAFGLALRGGPSPVWPPDRPIEWVALLGSAAVVLGLMTATISLSVAQQRAEARARAERSKTGEPH
jgi:hypothetical protein